jgi:hypothetical protein
LSPRNVPSPSISSVKRWLSASEPSHQTIFDGFVRRADSSTHRSSGVDTEPPKIARGDTALFSAGRATLKKINAFYEEKS